MKLLTHNMLACHIRGVKNNYPFIIEAVKIENIDADYNPGKNDGDTLMLLHPLTNLRPSWLAADFLRHIFPRINWPAFIQGATQLKCQDGLPAEASEGMLQDDSFLQKFHHALLEVKLEEGYLVCPETGRKFPVDKGIPNLLLTEDEC